MDSAGLPVSVLNALLDESNPGRSIFNVRHFSPISDMSPTSALITLDHVGDELMYDTLPAENWHTDGRILHIPKGSMIQEPEGTENCFFFPNGAGTPVTPTKMKMGDA